MISYNFLQNLVTIKWVTWWWSTLSTWCYIVNIFVNFNLIITLSISLLHWNCPSHFEILLYLCLKQAIFTRTFVPYQIYSSLTSFLFCNSNKSLHLCQIDKDECVLLNYFVLVSQSVLVNLMFAVCFYRYYYQQYWPLFLLSTKHCLSLLRFNNCLTF